MSNRPKKPAPAPKQTVVVAHLHPGQVSAYFMHSLVGVLLYDRKGPQRIVGLLQEWSSANVSASRNNLTAKFLDGDGDWLLWIDSDMSFQPDALEDLLASADAVERPIVGGLCFGSKNGSLFPTVYRWGQTEAGDLVTWTDGDYPRDALVQVGATGAAFVLIHRTALETIRDRPFSAVFPWYQEMEMNGRPAGEDLTFCFRAGICQLPVFVNTAVKVGHHKSHLLTEDLFLDQQGAADGGRTG